MAKLSIDIVTAEQVVFQESDVDEIIAPGADGEFAVLPRHAAFMTVLEPGVLVIRKGQEDIEMAVSGGFLEVRQDRVIVLADTAERAEEIDVARAEEARKRAQELLERHEAEVDLTRVAASLQRSLARLRAVERRRRRPRART